MYIVLDGKVRVATQEQYRIEGMNKKKRNPNVLMLKSGAVAG